jgi:outer membrane lipoprotein-sorting protein
MAGNLLTTRGTIPVCSLAALVLALSLLAAPPASSQPTALEIIRRSDELMRGDSHSGRYRMTVKRPDWERSMEFEFWAEGTEKSFIRILQPAKERGVTFLKLGREMWNFIPRINRVIKIPPSMMLESWMGSDFTNDDLVREASIVDDYEHRLVREDTIEGQSVYIVELKPKPDTPIAWDRIVEWIRESDYVPLRAEYYNQRGERIRTMLFSDVTWFGDRSIPARMELVEEKKPGRGTVLLLEEMEFNTPIESSVFTQQNLRRSR